MGQNSKTQIGTKLKNLNCDKTQKLKFCKIQKFKLGQNSKTQIVTKLKNSNCVNSKTEIVTKLKNSSCDKTQKLKLWQNTRKQTVIKP